MVLLGLSLFLASLGCVLGVVALSSWWQTRQLLRSHSISSVLELSARLASVESSCASLSNTTKRLSSKFGMRELREKEVPEQSKSGSDWKAAARERLIRPGQPVNHSE